MMNTERRVLTTVEKSLMLAMGLKDPRQLDELLAAPISQWAESHSESPDDEYELLDQMYEWMDRKWEANSASMRCPKASISTSVSTTYIA